MNNWSPRKKIVVIIVAILVLIGLITLVISTLIPKNNNTYGDEVTIKNYTEKIKNLTDDRRDSMFAALYKIVELNKKEGAQTPDINDAVIRKDSDSQKYNAEKDIYEGYFIVDIKSISQSYRIQYTYSSDNDNQEVGGYPVTATCLPVNQLIYGDFNCKDTIQIESAGIDPIIQYLPQSTLSYQIEASTGTDNKTVLNIRLLLSEADYRISEQEAVNTYKKEALDWIESKGLNPANYTINYSY